MRPYQFCNLAELNVSDEFSWEELVERAKAAAIFGTLQAGFTDFHYLRDVWKKTTEEDALIGVGMTGIASGGIAKHDLDKLAQIVKDVNAEVAKLIGINSAARCTTIKPSGTTSCVLGCSSGIHAWHSKYYMRRITLMKNDPLYHYLFMYHPELVEDSKLKSNEAFAVIPQMAPEGAILRTETAISLLERVKKFNLEWVKKGHNRGDNTNNVSATISVDKTRLYGQAKVLETPTQDAEGTFTYPLQWVGEPIDEWQKVGEWMWDNKDTFNGLSVLPYDGGTYTQAPFEDCDKDVYDALMSSLKDIDLTKVIEDDDNVNFGENLACAGDNCEVK